MLIVVVVPLMLLQRAQNAVVEPVMKPRHFSADRRDLGFIFLYAPIISLVVFSFNESKLVTVWGGFSTKWYGALFANPQVLDAGLLSLRVAGDQRHVALVLGTLCGVALTRFRRFQRQDAARRHGLGTAGDARRHHRLQPAAVVRRHGSRSSAGRRAAAN